VPSNPVGAGEISLSFEEALERAAKSPLNSKLKQVQNIELPDGRFALNFIIRVSKDRVIAGDVSNTLLVIDNNHQYTQHTLSGEYYALCAAMSGSTLYIGCKYDYLLIMDPVTLSIKHTLNLSDYICSLLVMPN
jgi:hypothetical protein